MPKKANPKSYYSRAKKLGISWQKLKYKEDKNYRELRKKQIKKSYLKYRDDRIAKMKEYNKKHK
jgi:hypothetical protein